MATRKVPAENRVCLRAQPNTRVTQEFRVRGDKNDGTVEVDFNHACLTINDHAFLSLFPPTLKHSAPISSAYLDAYPRHLSLGGDDALCPWALHSVWFTMSDDVMIMYDHRIGMIYICINVT